MTRSYTAGGNIDSWCSKCSLELSHTIVAMVGDIPKQVKCNTCKTQHVYRKKPGTKKTSTGVKRAPRKTKSKVDEFALYFSKINDIDSMSIQDYSIKGNFENDQIINHSKFGKGVVLSVVQHGKIEVLFQEGHKLLVQNR